MPPKGGTPNVGIMILAILAFYYGYKKGKESGRSGALWAVICGFAFSGVQLVVTLGVGILLGVGIAAFGWDESILDTWTWPINIVAIILSIVVLMGILKYLGRVPDEPVVDQPPPPPPFGPTA